MTLKAIASDFCRIVLSADILLKVVLIWVFCQMVRVLYLETMATINICFKAAPMIEASSESASTAYGFAFFAFVATAYIIIAFTALVYIIGSQFMPTTPMLSSLDSLFYNKLFETMNGSPPSKVYDLNNKLSTKSECSICKEEFNVLSEEKECILKCGHRYHKACLRKWEEIKFKVHMNPFNGHTCPMCKSSYNLFSKWRYDYK
eukprot:499191_1